MDLGRRFWIALAIVLAPAIAFAGPKRGFTLEIAGSDWRAEALATALRADLADDQLEPGKGELVVRGAIEADVLRYELRATWPGAPAPVHGAIRWGGDRVAVAGVLRDQLHRLARTIAPPEAASAIEMPSVLVVVLALGGLAALLGAPFVFGFLRISRDVVAMPALRRTAIALAVIGPAGVALAAFGDDLRNASGLLLGTGGLAWGAFAVVTFPIVFPPLAGLGQIEHDELPRVLRLWAVLVAQRAAFVALGYAPVAIAAVAIGRLANLDDAIVLALVVPLALLVIRHVARSAVAVAALAADARLVDVSADVKAWDAAVRAYYIGYLRRNGLPLDRELLARVRILPGAGDDVAVYGGGLAHSRIVIPRKMLELALAPWGRPHDYAAPRVSTLHWQQWNAGLVVPTEPGAIVATREQRQPRDVTDLGESERELLGEPPTLAGIIEPTALDPRTAYRPHDDPMWLDWDSGEEYDGTDAGDRDFLFGVLVQSLGTIQRHADRVATLALLAPPVPKLAPVMRFLRRAPEAVGDAHTALGGARHHLVQYLGWRLWHREELLTARAYAPELETASRRVLFVMTESEANDEALGARLARLGAHIRGAPPAPVMRWRKLALASVLVAGAGAAVFAIVDAVRYHAIYAERMENHGKAK